MNLSNLKPAEGSIKNRKRIGRGQGSGRGGTSTKGHKGAQSRTGYSRKIGFEGGQMPLHMRLPKLRGFTPPNKIRYQVVNVSDISRLFPQGGEVTPASLVKVGAIRKGQPVKVLGFGEITVKVTVVADKFSESASSKIAAAGGSIKAL